MNPKTHKNFTSPYRFGMNGMERDDEVKGSGNSYDFGARMYDPRVGRWLSIDAVSSKKPDLSPYQGFRNNPIIFLDPDGNDEYLSIVIKQKGKPDIKIIGHEVVSKNVRAGAIHEFPAPSLWEYQNYYDFRTVVTITLDETGSPSALDIVQYTLTDKIRHTEKMFSSTLSGVTTGTIVDPNTPGFDWSLEGKGGSQNGGYTMVSSEGGASPTKQRSLSNAEERNIEDILTYTGLGGQRGQTIKDNDFTDCLDDILDMLDEAGKLDGGGSSSNEIPGNENTYSNKVYPDPNSVTGKGTERRVATPQERMVGDTAGGNPDIIMKKPYGQNKSDK